MFNSSNSYSRRLSLDANGYAFFDLDGTLFDDAFRKHQFPSNFELQESLITPTSDTVYSEILANLAKLSSDGYQLIVLTGRRNSYLTRKQLNYTLDQLPYHFIRNSKLVNPTLSSKVLKNQVFKQLSAFLHLRKVPIRIFEDREDVFNSIMLAIKNYQACIHVIFHPHCREIRIHF